MSREGNICGGLGRVVPPRVVPRNSRRSQHGSINEEDISPFGGNESELFHRDRKAVMVGGGEITPTTHPPSREYSCFSRNLSGVCVRGAEVGVEMRRGVWGQGTERDEIGSPVPAVYERRRSHPDESVGGGGGGGEDAL